MVHSTGGKRGGNIELDRQVTALGSTREERRIRVSIGSRDPKKLRRANAILDKMIENEQYDTIRAWKAGDITTPELLEADRKGKSALSLSNVKLGAFLWDRTVPKDDLTEETEPGAVSRALAKVPGAVTRSRYLDSFGALQRKAADDLSVDAKVRDLLAVDWAELYDRWGASNTDWMLLRRALSRFASLHLGDKWDPFARQLRAAVPAKRVKKRRPKLTVDQFVSIVSHAPAHAAAAYWVLAITGVRVRSEYLRSSKTHLHRAGQLYEVPGTKTEGSENILQIDPRWWPYLERGIPSRIKYKWLRIYWIRACSAAGVQGITLHDLRHCHGQWAINAGVAESKVQGSLRHENAAQTRDYVMQSGTLDVSTALADRILGAPKAPRKQRKG